MKVLVTGGAGYIGSHVVYALLDGGHDVVVLDDLSTGVRQNLPEDLNFVVARAGDMDIVRSLAHRYEIDSVMHFAGSIIVPESVENPLKYYENNTSESRNLLAACHVSGVKRFIFSSTAAVYGSPEVSPLSESVPTAPVNPYGWSKWMVERMLADARAAHDLNYVALRYFNVAGADPDGRTGQSTPQTTHLIKVACQAALGIRDGMQIFGDDYATPDGTCVRDYIHVSDLAEAHVRALEYLADGGESGVYNCGYGRGYSVREVVEAVRAVSGKDFEARVVGRRPGDPASVVSDPSKLRQVMKWTPRHDDLTTIIRTALKWEDRQARSR